MRPRPASPAREARRWKALVVDEHAPSCRTLAAFLAQYSQIDVVGEHEHADPAARAIHERRPDLLFVDVQMPGATTLDAVRGCAPVVVYTTAHADYALRGLETHAENYLLKPLCDERFMHVMARVLSALDRAHAVTIGGRPRGVTIHEGARPTVIPASQIDWIEAEDYCARLHIGRRKPLVRRSLPSLLEELGSDGFMRTHRSVIVNVGRVRDVRPRLNGDGEADAILWTGATVAVSPSYRPQLENRVRDLALTKSHHGHGRGHGGHHHPGRR